MSQHKTGVDSTFDKGAYWRSRKEDKCTRDSVETPVVRSTNRVADARSDNRSVRRQQWKVFRRQERKGSTRGN